MIVSLILGIIVGGLAVVFAFQNTAIVTVSFLQWEITASLALVLLGTLLSGAIVALLMLLPSLIRDEMYLSALRKQKREAEDELARHRVEMQKRQEEAAAHQNENPSPSA